MAAQTAGRARRPTPAEAALVQVYRDAEHALLGAVTDQVADVVRADDDDTPAARAAGATRVREAAEHVVEGLQRG
ncbi:MAG: hypothetical protein L0I24_23495, partial [Pseudonocardia sp.]|nr:hypothetical protein [Pseudonocardia sp.]